MAKVSLTKAELAVLDALIAEMQNEREPESTSQEIDFTAQPMFFAAIAKVAAKAVGVAAKAVPVAMKVTPIAMQAIGRAKAADTGPESEMMSQLLSDDGETLSVDKLIELRKLFD